MKKKDFVIVITQLSDIYIYIIKSERERVAIIVIKLLYIYLIYWLSLNKWN